MLYIQILEICDFLVPLYGKLGTASQVSLA